MTANNTQKEKIVKAAEKAIVERGYDDTSVNYLIKKIGIAKGTFYHYFPSKEDLIETLMNRFSKKIMQPLKEVVDDENLDAIGKIEAMYKKSFEYKIKRKKFLSVLAKHLYKKENSALFNRIQKKIASLTVPEFEKIIEQGIKEKVFLVTDAKMTAGIIVQMNMHFANEKASVFFEAFNKGELNNEMEKAFFDYEEILNRILGVTKRKIKILNYQDVKKLLKK